MSGPAAAEPNLALACTDIRRRVCSLQGAKSIGKLIERGHHQPHAQPVGHAGSCRCPLLPHPKLLHASAISNSTAQHMAAQPLTWTVRKSAAAWGAAGRLRRRRTHGTATSLERRSKHCHNGFVAPAWHTGLVSQGGTGINAHGWQPSNSGSQALVHCHQSPREGLTRGRLI